MNKPSFLAIRKVVTALCVLVLLAAAARLTVVLVTIRFTIAGLVVTSLPAHLEKETLRLDKHAFPWIGDKPIEDLGVDDVLPTIRRVFKAGHLEQAHRLREQISRICRYAIATGRAKIDPAHALSEALPGRQEGGFPSIVKPDDIGELLCAMEGFKGTFVVSCALRLAPYLFCRPGELRTAEWAHFHNLDGECPEYHIPPANRKLLRAKKEAKDAEPHIIPLPRQAVAILNELRALIHGVELRFIHNWHW